jgi:hypothetical protein
LLYFLQNIENVNLNYNYFIHLYGPFSFDLEEDISLMRATNILNREVDSSGYRVNYYFGPGAKFILEKFNVEKKYEDEINYIVDKFGNYNVVDLELLSTLHYVSKIKKIDNDKLFAKVKEIKPHFEIIEIQDYWNKLNSILNN